VTGRRRDPTPTPRFAAPADAGWREDAACQTADPDLFFPEPGDHVSAARAIAVCETCPVTDACLRDALATGERYGIRGGLTSQHRAQLRTEQRREVHRTARGSTPRRVQAGRDGITLT
jgi:WhiB family redox-sensing transcriptional regulator